MQPAALEAQRTAAETVAATAGGTKAGRAGGLLSDDTALAVKEGRGALSYQGCAGPRRAPECCSVAVLIEGVAVQ